MMTTLPVSLRRYYDIGETVDMIRLNADRIIDNAEVPFVEFAVAAANYAIRIGRQPNPQLWFIFAATRVDISHYKTTQQVCLYQEKFMPKIPILSDNPDVQFITSSKPDSVFPYSAYDQLVVDQAFADWQRHQARFSLSAQVGTEKQKLSSDLAPLQLLNVMMNRAALDAWFGVDADYDIHATEISGMGREYSMTGRKTAVSPTGYYWSFIDISTSMTIRESNPVEFMARLNTLFESRYNVKFSFSASDGLRGWFDKGAVFDEQFQDVSSHADYEAMLARTSFRSSLSIDVTAGSNLIGFRSNSIYLHDREFADGLIYNVNTGAVEFDFAQKRRIEDIPFNLFK